MLENLDLENIRSLTYPFDAVLIQDRNGSGVKVVEEENANKSPPIETSSQASVASTPESIAAVIDVQGDREKATGIRHAFIFRVRLEILALYLGYLFKEYTNRKDCRSDDERDRLEGLLGSRRGPGPNGKHGIYGIEDGVEGCNHESRDHGHLLLRGIGNPYDLLHGCAKRAEREAEIVGRKAQDAV